jgi:hypothetical protein
MNLPKSMDVPTSQGLHLKKPEAIAIKSPMPGRKVKNAIQLP